MLKCSKCHHKISPGDEYVQNYLEVLCMNCIENYIFDQYDICDIARELGMSVKEAPEEKTEEPEKPLPGQMDMFGGVVGEEVPG